MVLKVLEIKNGILGHPLLQAQVKALDPTDNQLVARRLHLHHPYSHRRQRVSNKLYLVLCFLLEGQELLVHQQYYRILHLLKQWEEAQPAAVQALRILELRRR